MGKVVVSQFITVDGVVEDPGGSENLDRGGWAFEFDRGDEGDAFKMDELTKSDALLLGRTTYEGFAAAWPSRSGDPFSEKFNSMPKYVVSSTLENRSGTTRRSSPAISPRPSPNCARSSTATSSSTAASSWPASSASSASSTNTA